VLMAAQCRKKWAVVQHCRTAVHQCSTSLQYITANALAANMISAQ
jgi:hypothetical protein